MRELWSHSENRNPFVKYTKMRIRQAFPKGTNVVFVAAPSMHLLIGYLAIP